MSGTRSFVIALAAAAGLAGCAGEGVPASPGRFDGNTTLKTLSGVGIVPQKREKIDYRPRGGIALPKNYQLPDPESGDRVAANGNAAWPDDPDVRRRRKKEEFEALPLDEYRRRRGVPNNGRDLLMTEEEANQGRRAGGERFNGPVVTRRDDDVVLLPSEYQAKKTPEMIERERQADAGPEPKRRYLTEPPEGYRSPVAGRTAEGQKAAQEAMEARKEKKSGGIGSWLGL